MSEVGEKLIQGVNEILNGETRTFVEVVHCENCKHKDRVSDYCMYLKREIKPEDFCCYGVQK